MKTLNYNSIYSNLSYNFLIKYYFDFLNRKINLNDSIAYSENNRLYIGTVVLKDVEIHERGMDFLLENVPHVKTIKSNLILNTGDNCIVI